jgi:hypothetical protein
LLIQRLCKRWLLAVVLLPLCSVSLRLERGLVLLVLPQLITLLLVVEVLVVVMSLPPPLLVVVAVELEVLGQEQDYP